MVFRILIDFQWLSVFFRDVAFHHSRHEDMRVRKSSCAKLIFFLLLGFFLILRLPNQTDHTDHAPGVSNFFTRGVYFFFNMLSDTRVVYFFFTRGVYIFLCIFFSLQGVCISFLTCFLYQGCIFLCYCIFFTRGVYLFVTVFSSPVVMISFLMCFL